VRESVIYQEILSEGLQEGEQRGEKRGREEGERSLVLRQLTRRVGELPQEVRQRIETLSLEQLENLGEALLDFTSMADLQVWLEAIGG
jgi:predicted transposase YdaD